MFGKPPEILLILQVLVSLGPLNFLMPQLSQKAAQWVGGNRGKKLRCVI